MTCDLVFGVFNHVDSFPKWVNLPKEGLARISASASEDRPTCAGVFSIPALRYGGLLKAFEPFINEALELTSLYREPDGPVKSTQLDLSIYRYDQFPVVDELWQMAWRTRYPEIDKLNRAYDLRYQEAHFPTQETAIKVLMERRPWLFAYDFKWCRGYIVRVLESLFTERFHPHLQLVQEEELGASTDEGIHYWIDDTMVEACFNRSTTLAPWGLLNPSYVMARRVFDYYQCLAQKSNSSFTILGRSYSKSSLAARNIAICGKLIERKSYEQLLDLASDGRSFIFPFGIPQLDEGMQLLERVPISSASVQFDSKDNRKVRRVGRGELIEPGERVLTVPWETTDIWIEKQVASCIPTTSVQ